MVYLVMVVVLVILVLMVMFALSSAMLLVGRLLGLLFPITTFQGALITTLVALGAVLAFLLGYLGRIGEDISRSLACLQEEDEADEEDEEYPPHSIGFSGGQLSAYVEGSSALDSPWIHDARPQDQSQNKTNNIKRL